MSTSTAKGRATAPLFLAAGALVTAAVSVWVVELSIPALLLVLIAALSLGAAPKGGQRALPWLLALGGIVATVGLGRFATGRAMTGIVEAGQRATARSAVWRLREVVLAEDGMRKTGRIDPDRDGVGSAALVAALAGQRPLRTGTVEQTPLLNYRYQTIVDTALGPASKVGSHLVIVCVPRAGGGLTARPEDPVDEELAERRFVAYAWPSEDAPDVQDVVFVDEHERILVLDAEASPYRGPGHPPPCEAALDAPEQWSPWQGKEPRRTLPGDR